MNFENLVRKTWVGCGYFFVILSVLSLICKLIVKYQ